MSTRPLPADDALIRQLISRGDDAVWYDIADEATCYVESDGQTPALNDGDLVGLIVDKSQGGIKEGVPLNTDPYLGSLGTLVNGADCYHVPSQRVLRKIDSAARGQFETYVGSVAPGDYVHVEMYIDEISGASIQVRSAYSGGQTTLVSFAGAGYHQAFVKVETALHDRLRILTTADISTYQISYFRARKVPGNHMIQDTTANKPTLRIDAVGRYLEFDQVDDVMRNDTLTAPALDDWILYGISQLAASKAAQSMYWMATSDWGCVGQASATSGYGEFDAMRMFKDEVVIPHVDTDWRDEIDALTDAAEGFVVDGDFTSICQPGLDIGKWSGTYYLPDFRCYVYALKTGGSDIANDEDKLALASAMQRRGGDRIVKV